MVMRLLKHLIRKFAGPAFLAIGVKSFIVALLAIIAIEVNILPSHLHILNITIKDIAWAYLAISIIQIGIGIILLLLSYNHRRNKTNNK
ncbi:MAG: hypothetical protein QXI92_03855 [Candidatus Nitrosocaldus sp.]